MDPWTIFSILGVVIPSVVFKKLKRLIYYKIPDWLTYGLQFLWYKIRKFCKPTRIHIPSGGRQFYKIIVQNMVASGAVGFDLNLNSLAMELDNIEYEPEQFPGLVYKLPGTRATFLLFSNGKIVCTGTRSETKLREAVAKLVVNLKKLKLKK